MRIRHILFFLFLLLLQWQVIGQTPGMIIKPALSPGNLVLDPDGDGYVSAKTNGVQLGFTIPPDNDVTQSEIPYVAIIRPDPVGDLLRGPTGSFTEIVGVDAAGNNAILSYNDGTNFLVRFRLDQYRKNSKSYSLLIDTDGKFGFTGPNADPNAVPGNPGFEAEIVLETNFNVNAYNVDGTTNGTLVASYSFDTNCQQSVTVTASSGEPDTFYDFYLPLSSISTLFTSTTPIRIVGITTMNPHPAIGNNAVSDVGGVTTSGSLDSQLIDLIIHQAPTVPGQEVTDRSACPVIDAVTVAAPTISGSTTEAVGTTITVKVYASNGVTLLGSYTFTTSGSTWTMNKSSLSPAVTFAAGQLVKATATAAGKGISIDNCNTRTVVNCAGATAISPVTITKISGGKGYTVANSFPAGTVVTWYNSDYTVAVYPDKNGSLVNIVNPVTTTAASQTVSFSTQQGQTFPNGVFYFTFQEPGKCVSAYLADCGYSVAGTSVVPVITTTPITTATTSISGTCGSSTGTGVNLYANGVLLGSTTVVSATTWTISGLNLTNSSCASLTASAGDAGKCPSTSAAVVISRTAVKPAITMSGCSLTNPTSVTGTSVEADGTIVTVYKVNPSTLAHTVTLGTATIASGLWTWTVSPAGIIVSGEKIVAAVTSGTCLLTGPDSDPVTVSTQTSLTPYTIAITTPTEGQSAVSGTITATAPFSVTLKLYVDQTQMGSVAGLTVSSLGTGTVTVPWSVGGLLSTDLYTGGIVQVTLTEASKCESALSSVSATVQCLQPTTPSYTAATISYCLGGAGKFTLSVTQIGVIYQLVNGSGVAVGPSKAGSGGSIDLYTNALNSNLGPVYVKAYKIENATCTSTSATAINFQPVDPTPTVTFSSTSLSVPRGTTTVSLPYSAKSVTPPASTYTIAYSIAAKAQGFADVTSATAIPASPITLAVPAAAAVGTYSGTITIANAVTCTSSYGFTITVYDGSLSPVISVQPSNAGICTGTTATLNFTANGSGTITYQWQSATSYGGTYTNLVNSGSSGTATNNVSSTYTTATLASTTYYRVNVTNANGTTTSNIAVVTVTPMLTAGAITGTSPVCAGITGTYSIAAVTGATSYTWSYSGSGVTGLAGTTNSASLSFGQTATSGTLSVTANNSCGAGTAATLPVTVNATPFINAMTAIACSGASFTVAPANSTNGIVPSGTTYSWSAPVVTGGVTGGATGSGASNITGTLVNPTGTSQTATYTVTPVKGSCTGSAFTVTVTVNPPISLTATPSPALCYGGSSGSVSLTASGGAPSYGYAWTGPSFSATSQNISSLVAGTYNLTVTDARGCTATTSAAVGQPASGMTINTSVTNVSCYGGNSGAITITSVTGGTGTKTYAWSDGPTTQNRTGLTSGNYTVTVTDANGCTQPSSAIAVTQPSSALSGSIVFASPSCTGGSNGSATLTVTTGTSPYTFAWTASTGGVVPVGHSTDQSLTGLVKGSYSVTITDARGCTATANGTVSDPAPVALTGTITNVSCNGGSTGSVDVSASGGTGPYTYKILIGGTYGSGHVFGTLTAGTYAIYAKDANGCEKALDFTVTQPSAALSATPAITNVSCNGGSSGAVSLTVSGGTSPYAFAWTASPGTVPSGQSTNQNLTGLVKGTYSVTITDAKGCTFALSSGTAVFVTEPTVLSLSKTTTDVSCNGGSNGAVDLSVSGGTSAYSYAWSNGITTQDLTGLVAGTYSVTVTDSKGCTATTSATITQPTVLSGSATTTAAACYGGSTGSINLTVTTGTSPYTYAWTGPSSYTSTAEDPSGLAAGSYNVTITDNKGCTATVGATVGQPASFSLSTTVVQPTCPPSTDGSISLTVSGGTSGYTYSWTGSGGGTVPVGQAALNNPSGLNPGTYSVTVTDSHFCTTSTSVTLTYQHPNPSVPGTITKN